VHRLTALMEINNEANKALLRTSHKVRRPENADVRQKGIYDATRKIDNGQ